MTHTYEKIPSASLIEYRYEYNTSVDYPANATKQYSPYSMALVQMPSGSKLIQAKNVLVTIPSKLDDFGGFGLDDTERDLFVQFNNAVYYTSLLRNTGTPDHI